MQTLTKSAIALGLLMLGTASIHAQAIPGPIMGPHNFSPDYRPGSPYRAPASMCVATPNDLAKEASSNPRKFDALQRALNHRIQHCITPQDIAELRPVFARIDADDASRAAAEKRRVQDHETAMENLAAEIKAQNEQIERDRKAQEDEIAAKAELERVTRERQQQEYQEQQRQAAIEAAKPVNQLASAYREYVQVQTCYKDRQGYLVVWVNDIEMDRARRAIHAIEQKLTKDDPSIDTDKLWRSALTSVQVSESFCHYSLNRLLATWSRIGQSDFTAEKDF
jgi:hypothetical protein